MTLNDGKPTPAASTGTVMTLDDGKQIQLNAHSLVPS
jgi:hypothetical protein